MKSSKKPFGQNLLTPLELIFPKMNILELGGFGPTAEIYCIYCMKAKRELNVMPLKE